MRALSSSLREYRGALAAFSPAARLFLAATFLEWLGHGVHQVLFNLYLRQGGHLESFIGHAIALNGLGDWGSLLPMSSCPTARAANVPTM